MENILPIGSLFLMLIGGLITVKVELGKRPTFKEVEDRFVEEKVCGERSKNMQSDIKEIKADVKVLLQRK